MGMGMTTTQKEQVAVELIADYLKTFALNEDGFIGVLLRDFNAKGLDEADTRLTLRRLQDSDVIEKYYYCFGFIEKESAQKVFYFSETGREPQFADDPDQADLEQPAYCIKVNGGGFKAALKSGRVNKQEVLTLYLDNNGDLYREPKEKYCYPLLKEKEPLRIILYFIKNPNTNYTQPTAEIASNLNKGAQRLRTDIGKINSKAYSRLSIGKRVRTKRGMELRDGLIDSKQSSGYRLNPKIKIIVEKKIPSR